VRVLLALVPVLLLAACQPAPAVGAASDLPGTTWSLERIVPTDAAVVRGSGQQVSFGPEGSLAIASCNQCSGRYTVRDSVLTVTDALACTRRGCPVGTVELERYLSGTSVLRREGAFLVVLPDSVDAQVFFVPADQ